MGAGEFAADLVLLSAVVLPITFGARAARRRYLPAWRGALGLLAAIVIGVATVLAVAHLLGTLGWFSRWPLLGACILVGAAQAFLAPPGERLPLGRRGRGRPSTAGWRSLGLQPLAAAAVALAALAQWFAYTLAAVHEGMLHTDSLWYHMPFAARFSQTGDTTALHQTISDPLVNVEIEEAIEALMSIGTPTFYPADASLLHAIGIEMTGFDWASVFMNLGWFALALLAAYCLGAGLGVRYHAVAGVALVLATPALAGSQPGEALNDVAVLALVLAALAFLVHAQGERAALVLAGATAGLAVGMKMSALAPAAAVLLMAVATSARSARVRAGLAFGAAALVTGGYWFARNLARTGSPIPYLDASVGPFELPSPDLPLTDEHSYSIVHYAFRPDVWKDWFEPSLSAGIGRTWPVLLLLALAGAALALIRPRHPRQRWLGAAVIVMLVAYLFTPLTAGGPDGEPFLFLYTLRYATPALALGIVLFAVATPERLRPWLLGGLVLLVVVNTRRWFPAWGTQAVAGALGVAAVALAALWMRRAPRAAQGAVAVVVAMVAAVGLYRQVDAYAIDRYANPNGLLGRQFSWAREVSGKRIAIGGFYESYPLYGLDLSNEVDFLGRSGAHGAYHPFATCKEWRTAVDRGDYDYVMTAPYLAQSPETVAARGDSIPEPDVARWTRGSRGARELVRGPGNAVLFEVTGPLRPETCG